MQNYNIIFNLQIKGVFNCDNENIERWKKDQQFNIGRAIERNDIKTEFAIKRAHKVLSEKDFIIFMALWAQYDYAPIYYATLSAGWLCHTEQLVIAFRKRYSDNYIVMNFNAIKGE